MHQRHTPIGSCGGDPTAAGIPEIKRPNSPDGESTENTTRTTETLYKVKSRQLPSSSVEQKVKMSSTTENLEILAETDVLIVGAGISDIPLSMVTLTR